jgi:hypothetical protein
MDGAAPRAQRSAWLLTIAVVLIATADGDRHYPRNGQRLERRGVGGCDSHDQKYGSQHARHHSPTFGAINTAQTSYSPRVIQLRLWYRY